MWCSESVSWGNVEPPTFRFSGRVPPELALDARASRVVVVRCCLPSAAAVAVTIAVKPGRGRPRMIADSAPRAFLAAAGLRPYRGADLAGVRASQGARA